MSALRVSLVALLFLGTMGSSVPFGTSTTTSAAAASTSARDDGDCDTAGGWYGSAGIGACYHLGIFSDGIQVEKIFFASQKGLKICVNEM